MRLSAKSNHSDAVAPARAGGHARVAMAKFRTLVGSLSLTVRVKVIVLLCAVGIAIMALSSVFVLHIYESQIESRVFERMSTFTDVLAHVMTDAKSPDDIVTVISAFSTLPTINSIVIIDSSGKVIAASDRTLLHRDAHNFGWADLLKRLDANDGKLVHGDSLATGATEYVRRVDAPFTHGAATIYVRLNLQPVLAAIQSAAWSLLVWLMAAVVVAILVISLIMQRILVSPIEALRDFAEHRGGGAFALSGGASDDISVIAHRLADAFNATNTNEEKLADLAQTDGLTDLGNRVYFKSRLVSEIAHAGEAGQMVGVMILNLDSFKAINDSLGHDVGDIILQRTADILRGCQRPGDTIARLGADEFGVILTGLTTLEESAETANRLIRAVGVPFRAAGHELHQMACVGLTVYPQDGRDAEVLMKNADLALSCAKQEGSGACILYRHELHLRAMERNSIERDLRAALAQKQFVLYYQPKVNISSGRIVGAEALIRWLHPERGLVPPDLFIPVAERCGFIAEVTKWVLDEACRQNQLWQAQGLPKIGVAVNVSAIDLRREDFTDTVANTLVSRKLSPQYLELEVTESMVMRDVDSVIGTLRRLRSLGVCIGIDDFGTGYSSLAYLKRFPVKRLKIDRSFIGDIANGCSGNIIPKVIIDLGHALGLEVLAEGVEDMAQLEILRALGCDEAQGYFLGRPMSAAKFAEFLQGTIDGIHPHEDIRVATSATLDLTADQQSVSYRVSSALA